VPGLLTDVLCGVCISYSGGHGLVFRSKLAGTQVCSWDTTEPGCDPDNSAWELICRANFTPKFWALLALGTAGLVIAEYRIGFDEFKCLGVNTLSLFATDGNDCTGWPPTVTLSPT
jgi:hypothetical protein